MDLTVLRNNRALTAQLSRDGLRLVVAQIKPATGQAEVEISCHVSGLDLELLQELLLQRHLFQDNYAILHLPHHYIAINLDTKHQSADSERARVLTLAKSGEDGKKLSIRLSPAECIKLFGLCRRQILVETVEWISCKEKK